jgi:hypothetical protein
MLYVANQASLVTILHSFLNSMSQNPVQTRCRAYMSVFAGNLRVCILRGVGFWWVGKKRDREYRASVSVGWYNLVNMEARSLLLSHLMLVKPAGSSIDLINLYLCLMCESFFSIFDPKMYPSDRFRRNSHENTRIASPNSWSVHKLFSRSIVYFFIFFSARTNYRNLSFSLPAPLPWKKRPT